MSKAPDAHFARIAVGVRRELLRVPVVVSPLCWHAGYERRAARDGDAGQAGENAPNRAAAKIVPGCVGGLPAAVAASGRRIAASPVPETGQPDDPEMYPGGDAVVPASSASLSTIVTQDTSEPMGFEQSHDAADRDRVVRRFCGANPRCIVQKARCCTRRACRRTQSVKVEGMSLWKN